MSARLLDGAELDEGDITWTWTEDVDDEGRHLGWWQCSRCDGIAYGDETRARHMCLTKCEQCGVEMIWSYFDGFLPPAWDVADDSSRTCREDDDGEHRPEAAA